MLLAIGVVIVVLVLAWAGLEVDHFIHAYPLQFAFTVAGTLVLAFALAAARFRKANERVPLRPAVPALPPAVQAVPLKAAPVLKAIASVGAQDARPCEGPECGNKVDDDPWIARVLGEEREHLFCSEPCTRQWQQAHRPWEARRP